MQELSKSKISLIRSLSIKKYRQEHKLFIAEGQKVISEILDSDYTIKFIVYNTDKDYLLLDGQYQSIMTNNAGMKKMSVLKTPPAILAGVEIKDTILDYDKLKNKLSLVVDDIQDPGNLGTIIRICDWFGIENLICSTNSSDVFNPKVIQASMGAFLRVNINYAELTNFLIEYKKQTGHICYGTFLEGDSVYETELDQNGLFILGNEGNGISLEVEGLVDKKIHIPSFAIGDLRTESLNIAVAGAVVASEFRRNRK